MRSQQTEPTGNHDYLRMAQLLSFPDSCTSVHAQLCFDGPVTAASLWVSHSSLLSHAKALYIVEWPADRRLRIFTHLSETRQPLNATGSGRIRPVVEAQGGSPKPMELADFGRCQL